MLLNSRMASIPCSTRYSVSFMKDTQQLFDKQPQNYHFILPTPRTTTSTGLQYFNMRVTQRLHRYRSMKKQWQEVATSIQNTCLSPTCESPIPQDTTKTLPVLIQKPAAESKTYCINDYISSTTAMKDKNDKSFIELDPLHSRIQQDLIKLRKFIKVKNRKFFDNTSLKTPTSGRPSGEAASLSTAFDDQENLNITMVRKASSFNKLKPLDRVKIAGCQMRPPILPKSESLDSGIGSTSNSSSTCSQYPKQQQQQKTKRLNHNKTFNIYQSRVKQSPPSFPTDSFFYRVSYPPKKKSNTLSKMSQNIPLKQLSPSKQLLPSRPSIPIPRVIEKKQPSFTKHETPLPPIRRLSNSSSSNSNTTTRSYTYAASSSSAIPRSMTLRRNISLLPILLHSSSCVGIPPREIHSNKTEYDLQEKEEEEEEENNTDDDYYHLLHYNHLINRLPKPVISILPRHGQDDYAVLFEQLDHIRETMPDSNTYDNYTRMV